MSDLLIAAVWVVTVGVVVYCGVAELTKLVSDDIPRRRRMSHDDGPMYFDVSRVEREALISARARRRDARRS